MIERKEQLLSEVVGRLDTNFNIKQWAVDHQPGSRVYRIQLDELTVEVSQYVAHDKPQYSTLKISKNGSDIMQYGDNGKILKLYRELERRYEEMVGKQSEQEVCAPLEKLLKVLERKELE